MKIDYFFFFNFFTLLINVDCLIILSQSSPATKQLNLATNFTAYANGFSASGLISQVPTAMLISNSPIVRSGFCDTMIVQDTFQIPCSTNNIYAYAEIYTFYLNGQILRGGQTLSTIDNFTIDQTNYQCGKDIDLTIKVHSYDCKNGWYLQLVYAIVSDYNPNLQGSQLKNIQEYHNDFKQRNYYWYLFIGIYNYCRLLFQEEEQDICHSRGVTILFYLYLKQKDLANESNNKTVKNYKFVQQKFLQHLFRNQL